MAAMAGGFASCLAWLPTLTLRYWGKDLEHLALAKSLQASGTSWGESARVLMESGTSPAGAFWWRFLARSPVPNPQLTHVLGLMFHLASAAMVGVLVAGVLCCLAPGRRAARAGSLAAFLYGIHPGHFLALQTADGAMGSLFAFAAAATLFASLPSEAATAPAHKYQRTACAILASVSASCVVPLVAITLPLAAFALNRFVRTGEANARRECLVYTAWGTGLGLIALAFGMVGAPIASGFGLGSVINVAASSLGIPGEAIRRLWEGRWFSALVMIIVCGGIQAVVLSSSVFWARNILPANSGAAAVRLAIFVAIVALLIPGSELVRTHLILIGVALVVGIAFAVRLRAKALLIVIWIVGALFASEFERLSPWPATLERARVSATVTSAMNEWQAEERRRRGEPTSFIVVCADDILWDSLGGLRGVAAALRVDVADLIRAERTPAGRADGVAIVELTYSSAKPPTLAPPPTP